jgi:hypothetical protein
MIILELFWITYRPGFRFYYRASRFLLLISLEAIGASFPENFSKSVFTTLINIPSMVVLKATRVSVGVLSKPYQDHCQKFIFYDSN